MTTNENQPAAPVRIPNVSPGALSGLDHEVIGSAAVEAYEAQAGFDPDPDFEPTGNDGPVIPEDATTVDALLEWVSKAEGVEEYRARAELVLAAEQDRADGERVTLVEPLRATLADDPEPEPVNPAEGQNPVASGDPS